MRDQAEEEKMVSCFLLRWMIAEIESGFYINTAMQLSKIVGVEKAALRLTQAMRMW